MLSCASPAAAQPGDVAALAAQVRQSPEDVDTRLRLGLALSAADRREEAEAELRQVLAQAPNYWDAHVGLARIAYWRGDLAEAERRLAPALAAQPAVAEAALLRDQIATARAAQVSPWRVDLVVSYSDLTGGLDPWREVSIGLSRPLSDRRSYLAGTVHAADRFGRTDVYLEGLYGRTVGAEGEAYVAVGGTPDADFRPKVQLRAGFSAPLNGAGLSAGVDLAWAEFTAEQTTALRATLRQRVFGDRLAVAGSLINVWTDDGRSLTGYAVKGDVALLPKAQLSLGFSDAPESSDGRAVNVRAASASLRYELPRGRAMGLVYLREDRGTYDRNEFTLSTTLRF
ncbi:tetratricopeptide repeat protein [Phenylobacterium sp.]|uniref:tetratricopeptide repeat protein n=1 Tax=Phenylobacterium sp. TaxID=1871053 RepID=UPI0039833763